MQASAEEQNRKTYPSGLSFESRLLPVTSTTAPALFDVFRNILVMRYFLLTSLFTFLPVYFCYLIFGSTRDEIIRFTSFAESLSPYVGTVRSHSQTPSMIISYGEIYPKDGSPTQLMRKLRLRKFIICLRAKTSINPGIIASFFPYATPIIKSEAMKFYKLSKMYLQINKCMSRVYYVQTWRL